MVQPGQILHYIDDVEIEEPQGWQEFTQVLERNEKNRLIGVQYPIDLTFTGGAYDALATAFEANPCQVLDYRCEIYCGGSWDEGAKGKIFLSDVEWDLSKCQAKVSIADDSIGARILNNRKVIVYPLAATSKTGETITPTPSIDLEVFDPQDLIGVYLPQTRVAFDWMAAMEHLVSYISDGTVTVVSDWYDNLDGGEQWAVIDGDELRTADNDKARLNYSWDKLFLPMAKLFNLYAAVQRDQYGNPIIRIEPDTYWKGSDVVRSFPYTDELIRKIDPDTLYAKVLLGSDKAIKDVDSAYSLPFLILRGFTNEDLTLQTQCNTDTELDLTVPDVILDSNVIEGVLAADDSYDEEVFFIQYSSGTLEAAKGDYLVPGFGPYLYNELALNINVLNRYPLPADPIAVVGDNTLDGFRAEFTLGPTAATVSGAPGPGLRFDDDFSAPNFDGSNAYGNGTVQGNPVSLADSRYTAAAQGYATFEVYLPFTVTQNEYSSAPGNPTGWSTFGINPTYAHFDSANNLIGSGKRVVNADQDHTGLGTFSVTWSFGLSMNVGDYVTVNYEFDIASPAPPPPGTQDFAATIDNRALFRTIFTSSGGGVITSVDPDAFYSTMYDFERHIEQGVWNTLRDDQSQRVEVGPQDVTQYGYVKKAERNLSTGKTTWTLIANRAQE